MRPDQTPGTRPGPTLLVVAMLMARRIDQGFTMLGVGRAGGGLPTPVDAALEAGRGVR